MAKEKKDDVLDIMFALMKKKRCKDELLVQKSYIVEILEKVRLLSQNYPFVNAYDFPDLSTESLMKNPHVSYVNLSNQICFNISAKEAKRIKDRNESLVWLLRNCATVKSADDDMHSLTKDTISFNCQNPDQYYDLGVVDGGFEDKHDELYTDGKVTVLEERYNYKRVKVDNASFSMISTFDHNELKGAVITTNYLEPGFLFTILKEASDFYHGLVKESYIEQSKNVLIKRRH